MKKFLIKIGTFGLVLLVLSNMFHFLVPYYWGNPEYYVKAHYLQQNPEMFNTFFFGSSRTYRHVDPIMFDKLAISTNKSFNLGSPSTYVPEGYYLLENFIQNSNSVEGGFIIIELQAINHISNKNLHTMRTKYYLGLEEYLFAIRAISESGSITDSEKSNSIRNYTVTFVDKLSGIGLLSDIITNIFDYRLNTTVPDDIYGLDTRGHYSLDTEVSELLTDKLIRRNAYLIEHPADLDYRRTQAENAYQDKVSFDYTSVHLGKVQALISMSEEKGYYLIFMLPPRLSYDGYLELIPIFENIDNNHKIDLANPDVFPEFYSIENSFDTGHLNDAGVELFTLRLVTEFNKLLQESPDFSTTKNSLQN